ncbi:hypothetical protein LBMAG42_54390 [Deltaproteobacteria bacterium]|nr:hypothetical protein LBMAG42_54390 [Deltaproteobacteria bacterium]
MFFWALAASPDDIGLHFVLAELLLSAEQYEPAAEEIRAVLAREPRAVEAGNVILGLIASEDGRRAFLRGDPPAAGGAATSPWWGTFQAAPAGLADPATNAATVIAVKAAWADVPRRSGTIDGRPFTFLRDADDLLGPGLDVVSGGDYALIPFDSLTRIELGPIQSPLERIWRPVTHTFVNGASFAAFVPGNYAGSARLGGASALGSVTASLGVARPVLTPR